MKKKIFTHGNPDLDALGSSWGVKRFAPGFSSALIVFRSSDYDGSDMAPEDLAVDMEAGGRGIKGESRDGVVHSAFATVMQLYAPPDDQRALRHLVRFIDAQDSKGSAVRILAPDLDKETADTLGLTGINSVLRALQSFHRSEGRTDEYMVLARMFEIFDGMLEIGRTQQGRKNESGACVARPSLAALFNDWSVRRGISADERHAIRHLIRYIAAQDEHGSSLLALAPKMNTETAETLGAIGIGAVLRALQAIHPDATVLARVFEILDGRLRAGRARLRAEAKADTIEIRFSPSDPENTRVAIVRDVKEHAIDYVLFERGIRALVYIDGIDIGVVNHDTRLFRVDHPLIRGVVERYDTTGGWFFHEAGFLACCGSRKAPATVRTEVLDHLEEFIAAVLEAVVQSNASRA